MRGAARHDEQAEQEEQLLKRQVAAPLRGEVDEDDWNREIRRPDEKIRDVVEAQKRGRPRPALRARQKPVAIEQACPNFHDDRRVPFSFGWGVILAGYRMPES